MKAVGIIAEYNPFHGGHRYQISEVRRRFQADFVVVAMSGDFVQRGEPAVFDKYTRTEIALEAGADLVLELPSCFATSSAEDFATAGVTLLDRLGVVDGLCFGSESGDLEVLKKAAKLLVTEPENYQNILQKRLKSGDSFPKARIQALLSCLDGSTEDFKDTTELEAAFSSPNNILGIEYLKALFRRNSRMEPLTILRCGQGYHDTDIPTGTAAFPSASALRQAIKSGAADYFINLDFLNPDCRIKKTPVFADDLTAVFNWKLLELLKAKADLAVFSDLSSDLAARLAHSALDFQTFTGRVTQLKTRQYTYTRISRAILHLLLGITAEDITAAKDMDYIPYIRVLGFCRSASSLLTQIGRCCPVPLITKTADAEKLLDTGALRMLHQDMYASHLYQSLVYGKSGEQMANEYTRSVVIKN